MQYIQRVYRHIEEIGQIHWDALTEPPSFYMGYAWLRSVEGMLTPRSYYLTVWSTSGDLLGAFPCYLVEDETIYPYFNPPLLVLGSRALTLLSNELAPREVERLLQLMEQLGPTKRWYPSLMAAAPYGYTVSIRRHPDLRTDEQEEVTERLISAFMDLAVQERARSSAFLYTSMSNDTSSATATSSASTGRTMPRAQQAVTGRDDMDDLDRMTARLSQHGFLRRALDGDCVLGIPWTSLDEYVAAQPKSRRTPMRKEMRLFEQHGLSVSVEDVAALNSDLAPLQASLSEKYGRKGDLNRIVQGYQRIAQHLGPSVRVFLAQKRGNLVGFALFYRAGKTLYCKQAGFDYSRLADDFCYFNVIFYDPIRYAIANGIREIRYGLEAYEAKLARGCMLQQLDGHINLYGAPTGLVRECVTLQDLATQARLARLQQVRTGSAEKEST